MSSTIRTKFYRDLSVTEGKIAQRAIAQEKLGLLAVVGEHISQNAIDKILDSKVTLCYKRLEDLTSDTFPITDPVLVNSTSKMTSGDKDTPGVATQGSLTYLRKTADHKLLLDPSYRIVVGKISQYETVLSGVANFIKGNATVQGISTQFVTELTPGDFIGPFGGSGPWVKIQSIIGQTELLLADPYPGENTSVPPGKIRLELDYFVWDGVAYVPYALPTTQIDIIFPEYLSYKNISADDLENEVEFAKTASSGGGGGSLYKLYVDKIVIASQNVIPDLVFTPRDPSAVMLYAPYFQTNGLDFDVIGISIVWHNIAAGFDINAGETITRVYEYEL